MPHSFTSLNHHVVFSTRNRTPGITPVLQPRLYQYIAGILRADGNKLLASGGTVDHVHLLVSLSKQVSVSSALREIKSNSSGWVHKTFPDRGDFAWQSGYGAFAVSYSSLEGVRRYIDRRADHHRRLSFREEFIGLLGEHHIEFDERYLWG